MNIKNVVCEQFRNIQHQQIQFASPISVFVGDNGQGKTNILEAIYVLALSKSFRTSKDKEMIAWNAQWSAVRGTVATKQTTKSLEWIVTKQKKMVRVDGAVIPKISQYIGNLHVVCFSPEQLELIKGSPSVRRKFLDRDISQVCPKYAHNTAAYQTILGQRNEWLKQMIGKTMDQKLLDVWNEQLATVGTQIMMKRMQFVHQLEQWTQRIYEHIAGAHEHVTLHYMPSVKISPMEDRPSTIAHAFLVQLYDHHNQERQQATTLVGPHRDDVVCMINERNAHDYASQGQQRTFALAMTMATILLMHEETGQYPIVLLDDVLSELDATRQNQLITTFQQQVQTFISTTCMQALDRGLKKHMHVFHVKQGILTVE